MSCLPQAELAVCDLTLKTVNSILRASPSRAVKTKHYPASANQHNRIRRVLSFLLLALVLYGTTIQAVHRHGSVIVGDNSSATSVLEYSRPDANSSATPGGCDDCLICQLHQSFSATLVTHRRFDSPAPQLVLFSAQDIEDFSSFVSTTKTGRAPPFTS